MTKKDFEARLHPDLLMMTKFLKKHPKITLAQTVARLLKAEARLAAQTPVILEAERLANSESLYFTDEDGATHLVRPSALKRAVTKMLNGTKG